ncbi:unnamed protein product [Closterium sp. Yama58-4]|nr:unnamed protein product [Closterium sp. Yama58-4]
MLKELEMKRRARALAVPTSDTDVRLRLRAIGEPITLFGEREMERRDRLRSIMAKLDAEGRLDELYEAIERQMRESGEGGAEVLETEEVPQAELFYTEGSKELLLARQEIAVFSLPRAGERIRRAKRRREDPDEDEEAEAKEMIGVVQGMSMQVSEIGDERPISACALSPDASLLATSGWSGACRLWSLPAVRAAGALRGHSERATCVAWHPHALSSLPASGPNIATAGADRCALLWSLPWAASTPPDANGQSYTPSSLPQSDGPDSSSRPAPPFSSSSPTLSTPLLRLSGHLDRIARVAFHPSGRFLASTSFDKTWRLWDVERGGVELLLQEGHSRAVYGVSFQKDGALVATCGLDALCRVWDLRTGRSILALEGHVKPLLACDFSPNGYHLATGGEDHTCRVWDLRRCRKGAGGGGGAGGAEGSGGSLYVIPAHTRLVSVVRYEPREGMLLLTAGYDNTAKVLGRRFKPVKVLAGQSGEMILERIETPSPPPPPSPLPLPSFSPYPSPLFPPTPPLFPPTPPLFPPTPPFFPPSLLQLATGRDFKPVKVLAGHEGKVMGADVAAGEWMVVGADVAADAWMSAAVPLSPPGLEMPEGKVETAINEILSGGSWSKDEEEQLRIHFKSLPPRYAAMGYSSDAVKSHMALLREASGLKEGIPAIRLDVNNGELDAFMEDESETDDSFSSAGGISLSSCLEDSLSSSRTEVTFACSNHVCRSNISSAFHRSGIRVFGIYTFTSKQSSQSGKDMLEVLLCEKGAMKKKLGNFILDPLRLSMGPVIAVGASGEVRKGTYDGETVAVKVLKGEGKDPYANVAEFRREVVTLMSCGQCPQLLKFFGVCIDFRQRICIVTKFMERGTLNDLLRRRQGKGLPLSDAVSIARDVAQAMAFLHKNGMIHRDLKSANILLDKEGHAVVGDFGVARLKGERGEMTKEVGTYRWMAPEAFGTSPWPVTHKADVYSFGIVLWEVLTGGVPFADYSPLQAAVAVALNGARPSIPASVPESLRSLIERCWDKTPKERPEFSEILSELDRIAKEIQQQ